MLFKKLEIMVKMELRNIHESGPGILDCNNATVEGRSYRTGFAGAPPWIVKHPHHVMRDSDISTWSNVYIFIVRLAKCICILCIYVVSLRVSNTFL